MDLSTEDAPIVLVLAVLVVKELVALIKWSFDRKHGTPCSKAALDAQNQLREVLRLLERMEDTHSPAGAHHRAVELVNRRVVALLRKLEVSDPG